MTTSLHDLKDKLATELDIVEILDLLNIEERELLDYLDDLLIENKEELLRALR